MKYSCVSLLYWFMLTNNDSWRFWCWKGLKYLSMQRCSKNIYINILLVQSSWFVLPKDFNLISFINKCNICIYISCKKKQIIIQYNKTKYIKYTNQSYKFLCRYAAAGYITLKMWKILKRNNQIPKNRGNIWFIKSIFFKIWCFSIFLKLILHIQLQELKLMFNIYFFTEALFISFWPGDFHKAVHK